MKPAIAQKDEIPNPAAFGTSGEELSRLGVAFLNSVRDGWSELPPFSQAELEARLRLRPVPSGLAVFFDAALKHALSGNFQLAGKHYRSWLALSYAEHKGIDVSGKIRRQMSSSQASQAKQEESSRKFLLVINEALRICEKRTRPSSVNKLADDVSKSINRKASAHNETIPKETVRRYLKGFPGFRYRRTAR